MEIDVRTEIDEFRFADGEPGENNVCVMSGYLVINGEGREEVEVDLEDVDNLIEALKRAKECVSDGPDGPWADGWETRITGKEEARDVAYASMTVNARDFEEIPPVEFRWGNNPDPIGEISVGGWILHDGGDCPVHPMDIVYNNYDTAAVAKDVGWSVVNRYRHVKDEDGIPYCSNEGLEPWAEYVATDEDGDVNQYGGKPTDLAVYTMWWPDVEDKIEKAPRRYSNTFQHWTETLRRVYRG